MQSTSFQVGLLSKLGSTFFFTVMFLCIKEASADSSIGQIVFFRSAIGLLPVMAWLHYRGELRQSLRMQPSKALFRRILYGCGSIFCISAALKFIPVTYALSISYLAPLMIVLLAWFVLKETVGALRWLALLIGVAGMAVMLMGPGADRAAGLQDAWLLGCGLAFVGAFTTASATIEIRRMTDTSSGTLIISCMAAAALLGATTCAGWTMPDARQWCLLLIGGIASGLGQLLMMQSIKSAEASALAPLEYSTLLWAVLFALVGVGEMPGSWVFAGGAMVVLSGVISITAENLRTARIAPLSG